MIKILGNKILFLLFFVGNLYSASLEVTLSDKEIVKGESVFLTIATVEESNQSKLPPISEVAGVKVDDLVRTSRVNYIFVNGKNRVFYINSMTLELKPLKSITIPAFHFTLDNKKFFSKKRYIKVVSSKKEISQKNRKFFINMELDKSKIYKDESVLLSVYFRHKKDINLIKMEYIKPNFSNFFSKHIGEEDTYIEGDFRVYKLTYLLRPKDIGVFNIAPATVKVATKNRKLQKEGWYRDILNWHKVVADELTLEVEDVEKEYDIVGDFDLKESLDREIADINQPIRLTIELFGEGDLESYKGISFEDISTITLYSDDANISSNLKLEKVVTHYKKSFVFIASDNFIIPSKTIRIFNPKTKIVKILKTKSYNIKISKSIEKVSNMDNIDKKILYYLPIFTSFLFGIIFTLILQNIPLLYRKYRRKKVGFDGHKALQTLYPHIGDSIEVEEMVRKLYAIKSGEKGINIDKENLNKMLKKYISKGE